jgi:protein-S-isoprenylcysteine O-methyltransferase Ste14
LIGLLHTGFWSFLGLRQLVTAEPDKAEIMIVRGLYKWVRHPLYTAGLVFIWLIPLMTVNLLALNIGLSAYLVIGAYVEERKLMQIFGDDYRDYQERVPMIIPRPPGKIKTNITDNPQ